MKHQKIGIALILFCFLIPLSLSIQVFGQETWIIDKHGCKVFNPYPRKHESVEWSGNCKDGFANGRGSLKWYLHGRKSKFVFTGTMRNGKPEEGTYIYPDKTKLSGEFRDGYFYKGVKTEKQGKYTYVYKGYFIHDSLNGKGELNIEGLYDYSGEFINDLENGYGIQDMNNGVVFEGIFEDGYYKKGKCTYNNFGFTIEGEFKFFEPYYGTIYYEDSSKYVGDIKDLKPHDKGTYYMSDGTIIKGSWVKRTFYGKGEYVFPNGTIYKGTWKHGKLKGKFTIIDTCGNKHIAVIKKEK